MDVFRVRLNCVDHYQSAPGEFDPPLFGRVGSTQHRNGPTVPVIRVFGSTETGQKVCAHIHGALPYLYIEYRGSLQPRDVASYIAQLRGSINRALAISYRRNPYESDNAFVGHISLVKGTPFFGYHVGYRYYLKIYLLNPLNMTRFADLLYQGAILKTVLQPFESHLQYLLQWMCDFNLYGCAYIECKNPKFRSPVPEQATLSSQKHKWHDLSIPAENISNPMKVQRQSHCALEVDICVHDILNRLEIHPRYLHQDFVERFKGVGPQEKLIHSMAGLWRDETRRRKLRMGLTDPSSSPFPPEVLMSLSADPRDNGEGGWIHEAEYRALVQELINSERVGSDDKDITFEDFLPPNSNEVSVQTAVDSVEDLFPAKLRASFEAEDAIFETPVHHTSEQDPVIDLADDLDHRDESDEDVAREIAVSQLQKQSESDAQNGTRRSVENIRSTSFDISMLDDDAFATDFSSQSVPPSSPRSAISSLKLKRPRPVSSDEATEREKWRQARYSNPHASSNSVEPSAEAKDFSMGQQSSENDSEKQVPESAQRQTSNGKPQTLPYPVVKDPFDPATILSLSQREELPSSQRSVRSIRAEGPDHIPKPGLLSSQEKTGNSSSQELRGPSSPTSKVSSSQPLRGSSSQEFKTSSQALKDSCTTRRTESSSPGTRVDILKSVMADMNGAFGAATANTKRYLYAILAPQLDDKSTHRMLTPDVIYQQAHYSRGRDVPDKVRDYAGREFRLQSTTVPYLPQFDPTGTSLASIGEQPPVIIDRARAAVRLISRRSRCTLRSWEFRREPPSGNEVEEWLRRKAQPVRQSAKVQPVEGVKSFDIEYNRIVIRTDFSQIAGPTQVHQPPPHKSASVRHECQYMSIMSLEVHVNSREKLAPNPEQDEIGCIFWCLESDEADDRDDNERRLGVIVLSETDEMGKKIRRQVDAQVDEETTELEVINRLVDLVREFDPDILTGYEVHNGSWGYLIERARMKYDYDLCDELSRTKSQSHGRFGKEADRWGFNQTSTIRVTGRHMINIWRAMRSEVNLLQYTMENVAYHLLRRRIPHYAFQDLTTWYKSDKPRDLARCIMYFLSRVKLDLEILAANELVSRTSEQARLIGVDFFSVFSRGSQFKVESFMFRIAKPENFLLVSPSRKQVGQQNALECIPLVMEPQSDFYTSPVLVLDFQSLYPSIMIAYNYCYSTCLGRIVNWRDENKLGFAGFRRQPRLLELVKDYINIAPNGLMFVKPEMRKSLLAKMLGEILETRFMVKSGMKEDKDDRMLQQLLNNRQLALKLLANVTYGYTSASFSGRMPCAEIADSIVQTARETLEKAIAKIHATPKWGAEVVYGDTDSLFVLLKGRTKDQAFDIGNDIVKTITDMNPRPMKLKFEKVYQPCVLLAKKRYVGFKYESRSQKVPEFDAKGIETVRRDGTPGEQKIEERALKILFRTADLSQVKKYFQREATRIMLGKVSIQDFCFAKEVKLGTYSDKGPPPPGALISTRRMLEDPRTEPQYGERVPYVVVTGAPGARLIDRCVSPESILDGRSGMDLDAEYYISKNIIPPLERIFNLVGANVRRWYDEMPKVQRIKETITTQAVIAAGTGGKIDAAFKKRTIENYMKSSLCLICRSKLPRPKNLRVDAPRVCKTCLKQSGHSLHILYSRLHRAERKAAGIDAICRSCSGIDFADAVKCDSKDCPTFYSRLRAHTKVSMKSDTVESARGLLTARDDSLEW